MAITSAIQTVLCLVALAILSVCPTATRGALITNLFNTGLDASGNLIGLANVPDAHYGLIVSPNSSTAVTVDASNYPFPPWVANSATSRWIGPAIDGFGPGGSNYIYRTTFTVPANAILSTVSIIGQWAVDDNGTDILINGSSTGQTYGLVTPLKTFIITSGFVFGANTLDFLINNIGIPQFNNATGLRVDSIVGSYRAVPEPTSVCLAAIALAALAVLVVRRRSGSNAEASMF
jgi:hypothetical protein